MGSFSDQSLKHAGRTRINIFTVIRTFSGSISDYYYIAPVLVTEILMHHIISI